MRCNGEPKTSGPPEFGKTLPPLRTLYMYIAGSCNLACRHCWLAPGFDPQAKSGKFIPLPLLKKAVNEARPLGLTSVKLTGGEPMLHPDFREIVSFLASEKVPFTMETNGTLMSAETANFLRDSGTMSFVSVSIDGADPATHDALRGVEGSYRLAVQGIRFLVDAGYRPQMICTLHKGNLAQLDEIVELAERLGCGSVKFNHLQDVGRGTEMAETGAIPMELIPGIYREVEKRYRDRKIRVLFDIPIAFRSMHDILKSPPGMCSVLTILGILSGGEAALCGIGMEIPELIFGHVKNQSLEEIWNGANGLKTLRETLPEGLEGICSNCIHRDMCMGVCIAHNYHESRSMSAAYGFCAEAEALGLFPAGRKKVIKPNTIADSHETVNAERINP